MRKLKLLMVAFWAMLGSSAYAAEYEIDQKFTSIAELDGKLFSIVNEDEAKAFCFPSNQDLAYSSYSDAMSAKSYFFKLETAQGEGVEGCYYLRTYQPDGNVYAVWGDANNGYFNSQPADGWCCFSIGKTAKTNGQDIENGAVWAFEESGGKIAIKNIGTGLYLKDAAPAKYEEPTYFTFCTLKESDNSVLEGLKEEYNQLKAAVEALDDDTSIFDGNATVDINAAEAAIADAATAEDVEAAKALLREAALNFVTSVTVNEGKYFDLTDMWIVNPSVRKNINGWTASGTPNGWASWGVCNYNECEFYQQNFDFFQTLTLPKGTYEFGVTGFHRAGNHSSYFYAGEDKILIPGVESSVVNSMAEAETYFNDGNGKVSLKFALEGESNTIKIGIVNTDTETDKWTIFRDFTLHYYGSTVDYSVYTEQWAGLVADAAAAKEAHSSVTGSELDALNTALADEPDGSSKANYIEKIDALQLALNAFNNAAPSYEAYAAYKAETEALFGTDFNVAAPTTVAEAQTAVQELNVAQYNKVASDYTYSLSGLIGDFGTWEGTATVNGAAAKPNYLSNEHWSGDTHAYYEQASNGWGSNAWTIQYQKKCTLPAGDYVIKVAARASGDVQGTISCSATSTTVVLPNFASPGKGINKAGEASWSDGEFANSGNGFGWQWRFLPFSLSEKTEVTMTFYAETNVTHNWMSITDGELLSANDVATAVEYDETAENTIADEDIANVTMTRTIKEGYNTVVVPFDLTANQVAAAFGTGTEVYAFSENSENAAEATVNFNKGDGSITANTPVLIKATEASTSQTFEGVQIKAAEALVAGKNFDFVGTFAPISAIAAGDYFIGNGAVYRSEGSTSLNAFRAYIQAKSAGARIVKFFIDGVETTGIEGVVAAKNSNSKIYNLAGQEVKNAQKGLYIVNGKKVVIK